MSRAIRLLIVALFALSGVAMGGEQDGPYILVYRAHYESNITLGSLVQCVGAGCGSLSEPLSPVSVETYPTLAKVLDRLNGRQDGFMHEHPESPTIGLNDLIVLVKGKRIQPVLGDNGKKVRVSHNVWKTEDVPVQEWDVRP